MDLAPIGRIRATRQEPLDDDWDNVESWIELDPEVLDPDSVAGLEAFSHIEVVYLFDRVDPGRVERGARRPRGNPDWPPVGILAQRAKARPNRIGLTRARLVAVDGLTLKVRDLDAIDGTPVLDVKPWMDEFGPRGQVRQPQWSRELMSGYWSSNESPEPSSTAVRVSYDRVANDYAAELGRELAAKLLDRALLDALAEWSAPGPVLDAGCGPGQVAVHLATRGVAAFGCDLSPAMCLEALAAGRPSASGDLTALPVRSGSLRGITAFYSVLHLDPAGRRAAYCEMARVLGPGGYALIAFHTDDGERQAGQSLVRREWWGQPVDLVFHFLDPVQESASLAEAGLEVVAHLHRQPGPGPEYPSHRSYLMARRPEA